MIHDEAPNHTQQFEQAIATAFTCRTVIKYNSSLADEQKDEILSELDTALEFLQKRLIANARIADNVLIPPIPPMAQEQLARLFASNTIDGEDNDDDDDGEMFEAGVVIPSSVQALSEPMVRNLYRLYHAYLDTQPGKGMHQLETQYRQAMDLLDMLQAVIEKRQYTSSEGNIEQLLYKVKGLTSGLYCMFREFAAVLTSILEGRDIVSQTDELSSLQKYSAEKMHQYMLRDVTPLMRVYGAHLQLQQRRGSIDNLVNDAAALLLFLEEQLEAKFSRQPEMTEQLNSVIELLHEISSLLTGYEEALSATLTL